MKNIYELIKHIYMQKNKVNVVYYSKLSIYARGVSALLIPTM